MHTGEISLFSDQCNYVLVFLLTRYLLKIILMKVDQKTLVQNLSARNACRIIYIMGSNPGTSRRQLFQPLSDLSNTANLQILEEVKKINASLEVFSTLRKMD